MFSLPTSQVIRCNIELKHGSLLTTELCWFLSQNLMWKISQLHTNNYTLTTPEMPYCQCQSPTTDSCSVTSTGEEEWFEIILWTFLLCDCRIHNICWTSKMHFPEKEQFKNFRATQTLQLMFHTPVTDFWCSFYNLSFMVNKVNGECQSKQVQIFSLHLNEDVFIKGLFLFTILLRQNWEFWHNFSYV